MQLEMINQVKECHPLLAKEVLNQDRLLIWTILKIFPLLVLFQSLSQESKLNLKKKELLLPIWDRPTILLPWVANKDINRPSINQVKLLDNQYPINKLAKPSMYHTFPKSIRLLTTVLIVKVARTYQTEVLLISTRQPENRDLERTCKAIQACYILWLIKTQIWLEEKNLCPTQVPRIKVLGLQSEEHLVLKEEKSLLNNLTNISKKHLEPHWGMELLKKIELLNRFLKLVCLKDQIPE
jgi:hypothetical protein